MIYPYLYSQSTSLCFLPENVAENEQAVHNFSILGVFLWHVQISPSFTGC